MRIVAEVLQLSNGMLSPSLYCIGDHGAVDHAVTDTLLDLVTETWPHEASLFQLLAAADAGTYTAPNPNLPDWGVNDKNVWVVPPMAKMGSVLISNENIECWSTEYGKPQEFSIPQVRAAFEHWARFQARLVEKSKENLVGQKFETTLD